MIFIKISFSNLSFMECLATLIILFIFAVITVICIDYCMIFLWVKIAFAVYSIRFQKLGGRRTSYGINKQMSAYADV